MLLTAQVVLGSVGLGFVTLVVHPLAAPSEDRRRATFRRATNSCRSVIEQKLLPHHEAGPEVFHHFPIQPGLLPNGTGKSYCLGEGALDFL